MLIRDQAGWHKSKSLELPENIILKSLPPYSPELNPVEKLWQWLKKALFALNVGFHPGPAPMASINHDFGLHAFSLCLS